MDYEKKYNDMVKRARELHEAGNALTKKQMEIVCPELAESEDERMVRKIESFLSAYGADYFSNDEWREIEVWLEKHKEPLTPEEKMKHPLYVEGFEAGKQVGAQYEAVFGKQKEQKPVNDSASTMIPSCWEYEQKDTLADVLANRMEKALEGMAKGITIRTMGLQPEELCLALSSISDTRLLAECELRGLNQPAEWSEEDEKVYDYLKGGFEYATGNPDLLKSTLWGKSDATVQDYRNFIDKLKILRPQPKQEWSEMDEKMKERLITRLNWITYNTRTDGTSPNITFFDEIEWIKSLRPQPKQEWTEEDEEKLRRLCWIVLSTMAKGLITDEEGTKLSKWMDKWLNHNPVSRWKPSEEQMSMLLSVIRDPNNAGAESCHLALESLYNDLKKL